MLQAIPEASSETLLVIAKGFAEAQPSSGMAQYAIAQLRYNLGQQSEAIEHYRVASALDPEIQDPDFEALLEEAGVEAVPVAQVVADEGSAPVMAPVALKHPTDDENPRHAQQRPDPTGAPAPSEAAPDVTPAEVEEAVAVAPALGVIAADPHAPVAEVLEGEEDDSNIALIVGEGEAVKAHDKDSDTREKVSALTVAIVVHAAIFLILALVIVSMPRQEPPNLVATAIPSVDENQMETAVVQKRTRTPNPEQSAQAQVQVISVAAASPVALPDIETDNFTFDDIGVADDLGMSMTIADADGAGMVSFFGSRSKAQKVVFVVDSSASMKQKGKGKSKHELMKEELIRTLKALPPSVEFQIVFFSGPAWFVGDDVPNSRDKKDDWHEWEGKNFWHYKDGKDEQLPVGKYIKASPSKIRSTVKFIEETPATYGTDWRTPLKMAMAMKPDVIYFMTDGAVGKHPKLPPVVEDVLKFNKSMSRAKINSICLMVPKATDMLGDLAKGSRGEFTLVTEDGEIVRGSDIERVGN